MTDLTLTFLGTSAAVPSAKRGLSATALQRGGDYLLFDAGEGTQRQMVRFTGLKAPRAIFLTHYHPDHWLGLPGLLATLHMQEHTELLTVYGPEDGLGNIQQVCQRSGGQPHFVEFTVMRPEDHPVWFTAAGGERYSVRSFKTDHTKHSQGYVFEEPERPGRFDPNLAILSGITPGPDFKRLQAGETVKGLRPSDVIGPARPGRKIVITGDTHPTGNTSEAAAGADVLVHEATFTDEYEDRAAKTRHSTGRQAGRVAALAQPDRLVLTHFSPRRNAAHIVEQASQEFNPVVGAHDGMSINVPLAS